MKNYIFILGALISFILPLFQEIKGIAAGLALLIGIILASTNVITTPKKINKYRKLTLNGAVVLFGFGLNIQQVISVGASGILKTALSLVIIISIGFILMKLLKIDKIKGQLLTYGTAICGGSAIAATAPLVNANDEEIGISTGVIFLLNTVALFLFSIFAGIFPLTNEQFGIWCALSIHDTSSVVGAASFNYTALQVATIMKLTRTLWIIPIVLVLAFLNKENKKISFPYFIIFFILASVISSLIPNLEIYSILTNLGKSLLSLALYLVGTTLSIANIKKAGKKSLAFGVILWFFSIIFGYLITTQL